VKSGESEAGNLPSNSREVARTILGVPTRTANEAVLGELGWWELRARREKARMKLLKKLSLLAEDEHAKVLSRDSESLWRNNTISLLRAIQLDEREMILHNEKEWRNIVTTRYLKCEEQRWQQRMNRKTKLRTYVRIKDKLRFENYLKFRNRKARVELARLRSGANSLRIETGRHTREPVEQRLCKYCGVVEDEEHFLMDCDLMSEIRNETLTALNANADHDKTDTLRRLTGSDKLTGEYEEIITRHIINSMKTRDRFLALL
jgi:hypothetical protein